MAWRLAKSLTVLRDQVNKQWPGRSKSSDGTIGDAKHASRSSDHNPWVKDGKTGVVTAIDFTHDPSGGCDAGKLAESLRTSHDSRIKYIIWNKRIANSQKTGGAAAWAWRTYSGANPHDKHMHLSVKSDKAHYDNVRPWNLPAAAVAEPVIVTIPVPVPVPDTVKGDPAIWQVQRRLKAMNYNPGEIDGIWGGNTAGAIVGFINDRQTGMPAPTSLEMFRQSHDALALELAKAESEPFKRPVSVERAEITPTELAEKKPDVAEAKQAERVGFWAFIGTAFTTGATAVVKTLGEAVEWLTPLKTFVGDVPWPVWVVGALVGSGLIFYVSRKAGNSAKAATQAYNEGSRA